MVGMYVCPEIEGYLSIYYGFFFFFLLYTYVYNAEHTYEKGLLFSEELPLIFLSSKKNNRRTGRKKQNKTENVSEIRKVQQLLQQKFGNGCFS